MRRRETFILEKKALKIIIASSFVIRKESKINELSELHNLLFDAAPSYFFYGHEIGQ